MNELESAGGVTTKTQLENYYLWVEPDSKITVCLKLDTVDRLQREALLGIQAFSNGGHAKNGTEVGGILTGRTQVTDNRTFIFVDDFVPVPCGQRNGGTYSLAGKDVDNFEAALSRANARDTPGPVGYYRSHNRSGLFLSPDDLWLIERHFRQPENLFLLIKTLPNRACTAGFFFWKNGRIQSEFTDSEAPLIPISLFAPEGSLPLPDAVEEVPALPLAAALAVPEERTAVTSPETISTSYFRRPLIRATMVAGVAAAIAVGVVSYRNSSESAKPGSPLPPASDVAQSASAAPLVAPQSVPASPDAPKTVLPQSRNLAGPSPHEEPKQPPSAAVTEAATVSAPTASQVAPPTPVVAAEGAPAAVPPKPAELPAEPPAAVIPSPKLETRAAPASVAPTPAEKPPASTLESTPSTLSPKASTLIGPQVTHQVTPAVPQGVGPKITTDVELNVEVAIDAKGKVTNARVVSTKGATASLLTIETLKAAQLFRFLPAQENGRDVASSTVLTFRFAQTAK